MDAQNQPADARQSSEQPPVPIRPEDLPTPKLEPTSVGQLLPPPVAVPSRRQRLTWLRTLVRNRTACIGLIIVLFFILMALLAPVIAPGDPNQFVGPPNLPPSRKYLLGTTALGKDVFRQTVWGTRKSLVVGLGTSLLSLLIAVVVGMSAAYFRGWIDDLFTLLMNIFLVIPGTPLLIVIAGYLKPGTTTVILALSITGWAFAARIVRSQTLSLREKDFVALAAVRGESTAYIIFREILPNMVPIIFGLLVNGVVYGISAATALSFLGLSSTTEVTWGTNLYWAQNGNALLMGAWWTFLPSGLCVALLAFGLALINFGMDEATNPRLRAEKELDHVPALKKRAFDGVRATPVLRRAH
jgi:peptide/nickel transport system permease protein